MNFIEEAKGHNYQRYKEEQEQEQSEEEEGNVGGEEEEEAAATRTTARASSSSKLIPFPGTSSSSNSPPFFYKNFLPHHSQEFHSPAPLSPPSEALNFNKKLDMMDLSLGNNSNNNDNIIAGTAVEGRSSNISAMPIEKEHMFDKVVTPSDVGKLNRLVIPKQHAEKYFPLDSVSNDKGLLLNFEDRNGKPWRFRYSYWNSSQSYVMTKGWSRFVKEKKLDAGDIVSFQRGVGEEGRHRLFIDWRRRPSVNPHQDFASHLEFPNQLNVGWGNRLLYSLPQMQNLPLPPPPQFPYSLTSYNVHQIQPYSPHYPFYGRGNAAPFYGRPGVGSQNIGEGIMVGGGGSEDVAPMVIDSVPVVQGRTVGKRLRLFGVNMDCPMVPSGSNIGGDEEESNLVGVVRPAHGLISAHLGSSTNNSFASYNQVPPGAASPLQLRLPSGSGSSSGSGVPMATMQSHELSKKGKSSLSFDLDL